MALNWAIDQYVDSKIQRKTYAGQFGFMNDEIDTAALSPLIVTHKAIRVFPNADNSVFSLVLPANYRNFVSLGVKTEKRPCNACKKSNATDDFDVYLYYLKLKKSTEDSNEFFGGLSFHTGNTSYDLGNAPTNDPEDIEHIYKALLQAASQGDIPFTTSEIYWEKYHDRQTRSNTIIIKSFDRIQPSVSIRIGDKIISISEEVKVTYQFQPFLSNGSWVPTRRLNLLHRYVVEASNFERTHVDSPIIFSSDNCILIDSGKRFLVDQGALNYVRKPNKVSLSLGIDCDLPVESHAHICREASATLALSISDPNWQARVQDIKNK